MSKKGVRVRYAELTTLLSILKGTVDMNQLSLENTKCKSCFWIVNLKFEFRRALYFTFVQALGNALYIINKEIYCRFDITD